MNKIETFIIGFLFGFLFTIILWTIIPEQINSKVKLKPTIYLTTDGKTIDTLYIYKNEKN